MTTMGAEGLQLPSIEIKDLEGDGEYRYTRIINLKEEGRHEKFKNKRPS
jgi:hypothetical protein